MLVAAEEIYEQAWLSVSLHAYCCLDNKGTSEILSEKVIEDEEIKKLYIEEGLSTYQIGEKLGTSDSTISRRLKEQGVKVLKNTSNYYRVHKAKNKNTKQGFLWVYAYPENNKKKQISSVNFETLKKKVQAKGLPWYKINDG